MGVNVVVARNILYTLLKKKKKPILFLLSRRHRRRRRTRSFLWSVYVRARAVKLLFSPRCARIIIFFLCFDTSYSIIIIILWRYSARIILKILCNRRRGGKEPVAHKSMEKKKKRRRKRKKKKHGKEKWVYYNIVYKVRSYCISKVVVRVRRQH